MTDGGPVVGYVVTLKDVADEVRELTKAVNSFSGRLSQIDGSVQTNTRTAADHEIRIRSLERFRWLLVGASMAGGGVGGAGAALIFRSLHG